MNFKEFLNEAKTGKQLEKEMTKAIKMWVGLMDGVNFKSVFVSEPLDGDSGDVTVYVKNDIPKNDLEEFRYNLKSIIAKYIPKVKFESGGSDPYDESYFGVSWYID